MSTVVETSRLLQYRFFDSARACCLESVRKITFWLNIYIIAKPVTQVCLLSQICEFANKIVFLHD